MSQQYELYGTGVFFYTVSLSDCRCRPEIIKTILGKKGIMRITLKRRLQQAAALCLCAVCVLVSMYEVRAGQIDELEDRSSELEDTLDGIHKELDEIGEKIAKSEIEIETIDGDITKTEEQLAIARQDEETYYDEMKIRIQYIYENGGEEILGVLLSAESMADFVNKVYFVRTLSEYDRDMFKELQELRHTIEKEEEHLRKQQETCRKMKESLDEDREELSEKAEAVSADLKSIEDQIRKRKEEQRERERRAAEKAAKEAREAEAAKAAQESQNRSASAEASGGNKSGSGKNHDYTVPAGNNVLTKEKGVNYFNGHRETYYSQRVLPGHGLNIPGRHVASDGTIRDANGYLCLASSDYPKGTIVQTSLGPGIVYDSGCASGTIDIYTDW